MPAWWNQGLSPCAAWLAKEAAIEDLVGPVGRVLVVEFVVPQDPRRGLVEDLDLGKDMIANIEPPQLGQLLAQLVRTGHDRLARGLVGLVRLGREKS